MVFFGNDFTTTETQRTQSYTEEAEYLMTDKNDSREIFGWKVYDWANSAFYTTVVAALFSPYLTRLAQTAVGENGVVMHLGPLGNVTAKSLPTLCVSISVGAQVFLLPVLGALGDYSDLKKRMMALFCYVAVIANCLMFFIKGELYLWGGVLFIVANVCFGASNVFYNAFLPEIVTDDQADKVSSRGYAYGYLGGALLLLLNLLLVTRAEQFGMSTGLAVRLSLLSAGVWWGAFAVIGALLFERLAYLINTKNAIIVSLVLWAGVVIYAYGFLSSVPEAWVMAGVIAIVLGGSQALSRSLFARMIPAGKEASFFGLYEVSERGTSWMGPLLFSIVVARTGSYRQALLSLIFFFVVGLIVLVITNTDKAIQQASVPATESSS